MVTLNVEIISRKEGPRCNYYATLNIYIYLHQQGSGMVLYLLSKLFSSHRYDKEQYHMPLCGDQLVQ